MGSALGTCNREYRMGSGDRKETLSGFCGTEFEVLVKHPIGSDWLATDGVSLQIR